MPAGGQGDGLQRVTPAVDRDVGAACGWRHERGGCAETDPTKAQGWRVAAPQAGDDMWFAYDTTAHPARLILP